MPFRRRPSLWILALSSALALAGCNNSQTAQQPAPAPPPAQVGVVTLHPQKADIATELPGRTSAFLVADVRPQVAGILLKRDFTEGSDVKAGDLLYEIDPSTYQAAYDSAQAALQKAQANLATLQGKANAYQYLSNRSSVSQQDYTDAAAALSQGQADIAAATANLESAKISLDHTKVTAPISGQIGRSSITVGALVTANQSNALATIQQIDPIYVDLTQSTSDLLRLRQQIASGQLQRDGDDIKVQLLLDENTPYDQEGKFEFTDVTVDQNTGTVSLRASFPNPNHLLLPGMYVRAKVEFGTDPKAILIPQRAVSRDATGQATALFVDSNNKVQQRTIVASQTVGNNWLIRSGAADGDRVIVDGSQKAPAGSTVNPVEVTIDSKTGLVAGLQTPQGDAAGTARQD